MVNKIHTCIILLIISFAAIGNPIKIKGIVKDIKQATPISFVSIAIVETEKGTTSNNDGFFELKIDTSDLNFTLHFSCLGFDDKKVNISELVTDGINEISLHSISYSIPEVIVTNKPKKKKKLEINKLKKSNINGLLTCNNLPIIYARYFPYEEKYENFNKISQLNIGFRGDQIRRKSKVRLRLLTFDKQFNKPDKDILHENLVVYVRNGINKIDISKFNIQFPKDGIFVAVEWLIIEENAFEWVSYNKYHLKKRETLYGPILGANYSQKSYTWRYSAGDWKKFNLEVPMFHPKIKVGSYYDAAISLTLTNY